MKALLEQLFRRKSGAPDPGDSRIMVELYRDPEPHNWVFRVPSLHIIGGAPTHQEAIVRAVEAIRFALAADEAHDEVGVEPERFNVSVHLDPPKKLAATH